MANEVRDFFNSIASNWDSLESHSEEEKNNLLKLVGINKNDKVLDIACGTGVITKLIHDYSNNSVVGIDISENMINIAKEKYKEESYASFICADLLQVNEDEKYDVAIIYNAYPHFQNPRDLSKKLSKILNEGGRFAILHSLSRKELDLHHSGKAHSVSRHLSSPDVEALFFKKEFDIVISTEDDHSYAIVGIKKANC